MKNSAVIGVSMVAFVLIAIMVAMNFHQSENAPEGPPIPPQTRAEVISDAAPINGASPFSVTAEVKPKKHRASVSYEKDVWKFVQDALKSGDPAQLFEAKGGASRCNQFASSNEAISNFVSGGSNTGIVGSLTPSRQMAAEELKSRCRGFITAGQEGSLDTLRKINEKLSSAGDEYEISAVRGKMSESQIRNLLISDSAEAQTMAANQAGSLWRAQMGISKDDPRYAEVGQAVTLAVCDMSADCSSNGLIALSNCVFASECDRGLSDGWDSSLSEEQVTAIQDFKKTFILEIKNRDWKALGVGG